MLFASSIAERERAAAVERFSDLRGLTDSIIFDIEGEIEKSPTKARKILIERAAGYLDKLSRESAGDAELQSDAARAYEKIGDLQGRPHASNVGDAAGALESYRKALEIRQKLHAAYPQNADYKRALSNSLESVGRVQIVSRDYANALETFRRMREIREELLAENPLDIENRRLFAASFLNVGDALGEIAAIKGDEEMFAKQIENYRRALARYQEINRHAPTYAFIMRMLAILNQRLGSASNNLGERNFDAEHFRQSLAYHRRALEWWIKNDSSDADGRFPAGEYKHIGTALTNLGKPEEAAENFERARKIFERLAANDWENNEYKREIAYLKLAVARAAGQRKNFKQAARNYAEALDFFEQTIVSNPLRGSVRFF